MHKAIDLGKKLNDIAIPISTSDYRDKVHYPDLRISDIEEPRMLNLPDQGEATIKFKVVHRTHSEHDRNGKKERRCSVTLEVMKIDFEDAPKKKNGYGDDVRKSFNDYYKNK
jgi:hypothetical protein